MFKLRRWFFLVAGPFSVDTLDSADARPGNSRTQICAAATDVLAIGLSRLYPYPRLNLSWVLPTSILDPQRARFNSGVIAIEPRAGG